jgi:hypothetical protein
MSLNILSTPVGKLSSNKSDQKRHSLHSRTSTNLKSKDLLMGKLNDLYHDPKSFSNKVGKRAKGIDTKESI